MQFEAAEPLHAIIYFSDGSFIYSDGPNLIYWCIEYETVLDLSEWQIIDIKTEAMNPFREIYKDHKYIFLPDNVVDLRTGKTLDMLSYEEIEIKDIIINGKLFRYDKDFLYDKENKYSVQMEYFVCANSSFIIIAIPFTFGYSKPHVDSVIVNLKIYDVNTFSLLYEKSRIPITNVLEAPFDRNPNGGHRYILTKDRKFRYWPPIVLETDVIPLVRSRVIIHDDNRIQVGSTIITIKNN